MTAEIQEVFQQLEREKRDRNADLLQRRLARFNARPGPRVGDYLQLIDVRRDERCPAYTRFTHDWGDSIQTGGGTNGQYYMTDSGGMSYSGGLDPGIAKAGLLPTDEARDGSLWFFDKDLSGAGRGVTFYAPMRVFLPAPNADLTGLYELNCPYHLAITGKPQREDRRGCDYAFTISYRATAHTAFHNEHDLMAWIKAVRRGSGKPSRFIRTVIASDLKAAVLVLEREFDQVSIKHGYAKKWTYEIPSLLRGGRAALHRFRCRGTQ